MAVSKAQAAKRALYEGLLAALASEPELRVWHSRPNVDHRPNENIVVGRVDVNQEWGAMGSPNPRRDEDIDLTVTIEVFRGGTDEFEAEDRAWEIADLVQGVLSTDLTLGGSVRYARPGRIELDPEPYQEGRHAELTMTVRCRADNH